MCAFYNSYRGKTKDQVRRHNRWYEHDWALQITGINSTKQQIEVCQSCGKGALSSICRRKIWKCRIWYELNKKVIGVVQDVYYRRENIIRITGNLTEGFTTTPRGRLNFYTINIVVWNHKLTSIKINKTKNTAVEGNLKRIPREH